MAQLCPIALRTKIRTRHNIAVCDGSCWGQLYGMTRQCYPDDPYWISTKNSVELIELSRMVEIKLV